VSGAKHVFDLPENWRSLTDRTWILKATGHDFEVAGRLDAALDRAEVYLAAVGLGERDGWGLVTDPGSGRVDAAMTIGLLNLGELSAPDAARLYRETARAAAVETEAAESIERQVRVSSSAAGPLVTIHDFVLDRRREVISNPALERAIVALFPDDSKVGYEFSIQTQDLTVFDDIVGYLTMLVATVRASGVRA